MILAVSESNVPQTQFKVTRVWGFSDINSIASNYNPVYFQILNSTGQYFNCDPTTGAYVSYRYDNIADVWVRYRTSGLCGFDS